MTIAPHRRNGGHIRRPGPARRDADREADQVALIRKMLKAGTSQADMGAAIGRDRHYVHALIERHGLAEPKPPRPDGLPHNAPLIILIEPVRWPGRYSQRGVKFDLVDTEEL